MKRALFVAAGLLLPPAILGPLLLFTHHAPKSDPVELGLGRINRGLSALEVEAIFGRAPDTCYPAWYYPPVAGSGEVVVTWEGDDWAITVTFEDGEVLAVGGALYEKPTLFERVRAFLGLRRKGTE
jgi:hypothetical protein